MRFLWHDVGYGWRTLRNCPGFAALTVFTLALGIAAITTIFSWIHAGGVAGGNHAGLARHSRPIERNAQGKRAQHRGIAHASPARPVCGCGSGWAMVGLVGAGLFTRSFHNARALNPGFDPKNVVLWRAYLAAESSEQQQAQVFERLRQRLEQLPGVRLRTSPT
jgi:hypothetical protein